MVRFLLLLLLLLVHFLKNKGCSEVERMALLKFKAFVMLHGNDDADNLLPSWVAGTESTTDCCKWERVTCDSNRSHHVVELSLDNIRQFDMSSHHSILMDNQYKSWYLNISLFQPLTELRTLNLSFNLIAGWVDHNRGPRSLLRLQHLETLDLTANKLNKSSLPRLTTFTSLKNLLLRRNSLEGSFPAQELAVFESLEKLDLSSNALNVSPDIEDFKKLSNLSKLSKLRYLNLSNNSLFNNKDIVRLLGLLSSLKSLDLSYNQLEGPLSNREMANLENSELEVLNLAHNSLNGTLPFLDLMAFRKLEILNLNSNRFTGRIPPQVGALSSLKALSLSSNSLSGSLPTPDLCGLKRLQDLDLSHNGFEGLLPPCLNNLTSLKLLDLSRNLFTGTISLMQSLTSLEYVDLSQNKFEGIFPLSSVANLSKLEVLILSSYDKKLKMDLITDSGSDPLLQLKVLVLSNFDLDDFPYFLLHQHQLRVVNLSHNKLKGKFPAWLLVNNVELRFLNLRGNLLAGQVYSPPYVMRNTFWLDLSDNHFTGLLPEDFGDILPNLQHLNLSKNTFQGSLPSSIGKFRNLVTLDLAFNAFSGEVPKDLVAGCTNLVLLRLSTNKFHGQIFSAHFNLSDLLHLDLRDNQFTGSLPNATLELVQFDISNNHMTGKIPKWVSNVMMLSMRNNSFEGHFSCEKLLSALYVDLSHNVLSGPLPSCFDPKYIEQIHLEGNQFTGSIGGILQSAPRISVLNLRDNFLSGNLPDLIGKLPNLRLLSLAKNRFSGLISEQLCLLKNLSIMDLSINSFSGPIPACLHNINFGMEGANIENLAQKEFKFLSPIGISNIEDHTYGDLLQKNVNLINTDDQDVGLVEMNFVNKNRISALKGSILNFMSGLDVSCNNLTGKIPRALGRLSWIQALNLSHNQLIGSVPSSFSNLAQIESLDLSCNNLSGGIPSDLINLNFLEVFNLSYNNLSGEVPATKAQFGTFDKSSYEGNPFLCGKPLEKTCNVVETPLFLTTPNLDNTQEKWYEVDLSVFHASFRATFSVSFLGWVAVLYKNPLWKRRCFEFMEVFLCGRITRFCYYSRLSTRIFNWPPSSSSPSYRLGL